MDYNAGTGTNQPPPAGPREYIVEVERKRPVLIVIIAVLMLLVGLGSVLSPLVMSFSEKMLDMSLANKGNMSSEQIAGIEKNKEKMEKYQQHANVLTPVSIVEGVAFLAFGLGMILRKEWARIGSIVLLFAVAAYSLVDLLFLNWFAEPGQWTATIGVAIYALAAYYLTCVAWAFRPTATNTAPG